MPELACLNGQIMPIDEAKVPIEDRGLQFGDSVYEVIRVYSGYPWLLDEHMARLQRSMQAINMSGVDVSKIAQQAKQVLQRSGIGDAVIYIQVTRGVAPRNHLIPRGIEPNVIITVRHANPPQAEHYTTGVKAITAPDVRWGRPDIKSTNLLPNVLALEQARQRGAFEAILIDQREGLVTEGCHTNVFAVLNGALRTPPVNHRILPGITRQFVINLATQAGIEVREEQLPLADLMRAQEVFLTGTVCEVIGVTLLDNTMVGDGTVGTITRRLHALYREAVQQAVASMER
ncbi:MAG TPA: hypothetical protein EYP10_10445 [Armatimonadetes bacterium]|nr:hypothetical protein [Armatimonadota bacterium]